ncbi:MAG: anion transporter [Sphingobacteriia bacterium]|nr:anion transporter [Sphingobacteriia bacterium]NCC39994.1 anion transporter [Gammaproteobacteria bacterium]
MGMGALVVLLSGAIPPVEAWRAIDWEVIGFLFGVFVVGHALVESGWLAAVSSRWLAPIRGADRLLMAVILAAALGSAFLMNDTLAIIGTPLVIALARRHQLPPLLLLLALAFGVTIGSVMSPIGNPQNLLIASHGGLPRPFIDFLTVLGPPTVLNLLVLYLLLRLAFWRHIHGEALVHLPATVTDAALARLAGIALGLLVIMVILRIGLALLIPELVFPLVSIALVAAAPLLLLSPRRLALLRGIDWRTLVFFLAMFILMRSVWDTGLLQSWIPSGPIGLGEVLAVGVLGSQLVSNVPLVSLALPLIPPQHPELLLALAAAATIAGNLTLIGAASNIIIAQGAEQLGAHLGFWRFLAIGAPLTLLNLVIYWAWLSLMM